ncbi:hypothetical protein Ancab_039566 [Ancistrocladus abbreviatus]
MSCFPIASGVPDQCNHAATSTATVDSGPTAEGEYLQEFDSDGEYSDGDYDQAYWDRSGQIDTNLRDLRAKLKDQVFHDFKDQVHYVRAHVRVRRSATMDIEMGLQRRRDEHTVPRLEIRLPSPVKQQERSVEETELHVAAREGHVEIILQILRRNVELIANENSKGDLPLHEAARAGRLDAVVTLTLFMMQFVKPELPIGKANMKGNTALHLAVQNGHQKTAYCLIQWKPETSYSSNKEGISPLYLAIEARFQDLVRYMLFKISSRNYVDQPSPKKSVLHAAIRAQDNVILKTLLKKLHPMVNSFDEQGQTPLSYSAYIGYLDGVIFILDKFPRSAFICDKDGSYPIHKASGRGYVEIVEQFLLRIPETIGLLNGHDQNILHVAAMSGSIEVVSYLLKMQGIKKLMDMRDRDGNTALDLATMNDHLEVVSCLEDVGKCLP